MIRVHIERTEDGRVEAFTMDGHADFAEHGQDIVCAGASAVAFGSLNAIMALTGAEPELEQGESGFLRCTVPGGLPDDVSSKVQLLLEAMIVSLRTIERDYGKYIKIKVHQ